MCIIVLNLFFEIVLMIIIKFIGGKNLNFFFFVFLKGKYDEN